MADSPAATQGEQPKKVTFRFCRECANLLYPKEDKANQRLEFACRTCYYSEPAETTCIFRNEIANTVGETAGITQDIGEDPTVGDCDDFSDDPNADFYSQPPSSFSFPADSPAASVHFSADPYAVTAAATAVPDFCTMCGQEIFCEFCGQPSDRGCFLEADEEQADQLSGMMTPASMTSEMMESSHTQLQQLRLRSDQPGGDGGNRQDSVAS
ncbi:uncharacterized protein PV09_07865 [Verruconis gallopava]|uniref:DNA-directed RNA polymerase II subunit RPB9-like zinc ribbon domain-containing protein n=1 Tax=Verruconis gallopava TaxID=253628 RepID=A0A0D1XEQ1_9PEZI|nr:uncharacterized protein PV09_07865 [Verruconis gallopava]KIW00681.1 hypothetical protein PV09_07865 [Verruconis gallopava]